MFSRWCWKLHCQVLSGLLQYLVLYLRLEHVLPMVLKASLSSIVPSRFRITRNGKFAKNYKSILQIICRQKLWIFQPSQLFSRLVLQAKQKLELSKERKNFRTFLVKAFFLLLLKIKNIVLFNVENGLFIIVPTLTNFPKVLLL